MKYYPSYLSFTQENRKNSLTIEGDDLSNFDLSQSRIVAISSDLKTLTESVCSAISVESISTSRFESRKVVLNFEMTPELSEKLKNCVTDKKQYIALQIDIPTQKSKGKVSTQQRVILPFFDSTGGNLLTAERSQSVLGELSAKLRINNLVCDKKVIFIRSDVFCSTEISNATDSAVLANILTSVREGLPPGTTLRENLERTNLLLLPGQSYTISVTIPKEVYKTLHNKISIVSNFTSIGAEGAGFAIKTENLIWFLPPAFLALFGGILLVISAILFRKKMINFIARQNGSHKTNV